MKPVKIAIGSYRGQTWLSRRIALWSAPMSRWPQLGSKNRLPSHSFIYIEYSSGHAEAWETHPPTGYRCTPWLEYQAKLEENPKRWVHLRDLNISQKEKDRVVEVCMDRLRSGDWSDYPESQIFSMFMHQIKLNRKVKEGNTPVCSQAVAMVLWQATGIDLRIWRQYGRVKSKQFQELSPWWVRHVPIYKPI